MKNYLYNVPQYSKRSIICSSLLQAFYAGACAMMGMLFVAVRQYHLKVDWAVLSAVILPIMAVAADYGYRWYLFTLDVQEKGKRYNLLPAIVGVFMYLSLTFLTRQYVLLGGLCIEFSLLFTVLNDCMTFRCETLLSKYAKPSSRRFTIIMPLVFISMQSTLFGSCVVLACCGNWLSLVVYSAMPVYFLVWYNIRKKDEKVLFRVNIAVYFIAALLAGLFFWGYYQEVETKAYSQWISIPIKAISLALFCSGIIAIPGLTDLSQIQRTVKRKTTKCAKRCDTCERDIALPECRDYDDRSRVLSIMTFCAVLCVFVTWTWIKFSPVYLVAFAIVSWIWVFQVKFRRKYYYGNLYLPLVYLLCTVGFLCSEFLGLWDKFSVPNEMIPVMSSGLYPCLFTASNVIIPALIKLWRSLKKVGKQQYLRQIYIMVKGIRVLGAYMAALFVTVLVLWVALLFGGDSRRISFATYVVCIDAVLAVIRWSYYELIKKT